MHSGVNKKCKVHFCREDRVIDVCVWRRVRSYPPPVDATARRVRWLGARRTVGAPDATSRRVYGRRIRQPPKARKPASAGHGRMIAKWSTSCRQSTRRPQILRGLSTVATMRFAPQRAHVPVAPGATATIRGPLYPQYSNAIADFCSRFNTPTAQPYTSAFPGNSWYG